MINSSRKRRFLQLRAAVFGPSTSVNGRRRFVAPRGGVDGDLHEANEKSSDDIDGDCGEVNAKNEADVDVEDAEEDML